MIKTEAIPNGTQLGDEFVITSLLGAGGFGITYRVRSLKVLNEDIGADRDYVVKECFPGNLITRGAQGVTITAQASDPDDAEHQLSQFRHILENFVEEARVLARFAHPNIVRVYLLREAYSTAYMIMEFIDGPSFHDCIKEYTAQHGHSMRMSDLAPYAYKLVDALKVVHEGGIVHRDIKPTNIMIRRSGEPVLIDFGGAKALGDANKSVVYTPGFAPPEQAAGRGATEQSDIYSLAVTFYYALTGTMPHGLDANGALVQRPLLDFPERPKLGISDAFAEAIDWALEFDPSMRPRSVREWEVALFPVQPELAEVSGTTGRQPSAMDAASNIHVEDVGIQPISPSLSGYTSAARLGPNLSKTTVTGLALGGGAVLLALLVLILQILGVFTSKLPEQKLRTQVTVTSQSWTSIDLSKAPSNSPIGLTADGRFRARVDGVLYSFVDGNALDIPALTSKTKLEVKAEETSVVVNVLY